MMSSVAEDIMNLLHEKSNLLSPYGKVFVFNSLSFSKMLSFFFLVLFKKDCPAE